jgi:RNA polymerase sigma-70 factor (ECF subfamily)
VVNALFIASIPQETQQEALLSRCRRGDGRAQKQLYDENIRFVLGSARRLGLPPAELEDVAQEVFATTFDSIDRVKAEALQGWLYQLVSHRVHSHHRRRRIRERFSRWFGQEALEGAEADPMNRRDSQRQLDQLLAKMIRSRREVLVLFELEGLSGEAIAGRLQISVASVWTRLHRARHDLVRIARSLHVLDELELLAGASK